jgi:hypothetical protein
MPQFVYKEAPDVDYYVLWSSVVDAPTFTGTREEMLADLKSTEDPWLKDDAPHKAENRLARADETGTSSKWVETEGMLDQFPEDGSWADDTFIFQQEGVLTRANLFKLCHRLDADRNADVSDLLQPFEDHPHVVTIDLTGDEL